MINRTTVTRSGSLLSAVLAAAALGCSGKADGLADASTHMETGIHTDVDTARDAGAERGGTDIDVGTDLGAGTDPDAATDAGLPPFNFSQASTYSSAAGGTAVLAMLNGQIVFEEYHNGADELTAAHVHSATKAFWASACAAAIEDGLISGLDERVSDTITEWRDQTAHPGKNRITVQHLLELTSGLSQDLDQIQGEDALAPDIYQYVVDHLSLNWTPGSTFQYGPSHYYAFAVVLERKLAARGLAMNPLEYLKSRILDRIGVVVDKWTFDASGNPHIPNGAYLTPRNWIKYGTFVLQTGQWEGEQIVDHDRMSAMRLPSAVNPGHGKFLWLNSVDGHGLSDNDRAPAGSPGGFIYHNGFPRLIGALGAGKNRMYIIPDLNMVVLRQTLQENDTFEDHDFLERLFGE